MGVKSSGFSFHFNLISLEKELSFLHSFEQEKKNQQHQESLITETSWLLVSLYYFFCILLDRDLDSAIRFPKIYYAIFTAPSQHYSHTRLYTYFVLND